MSTHDYNIQNQSGFDFRADLNNALSAIATTNSSATEPSTTFAHQLWVDTGNNVLKIRNGTNSDWITTGISITTSNILTGNLTGNVTGNLTGNVTGNVTGDLTGNADTATTLATARTISLSGDVVGSASFDGSDDITITTTAQIDSIALGTDTTGDYVQSISGGTGVTVTGGTGEGSNPSVAIGQAVATTDDVTFNLVTATNEFVGDICGAVRFSAKAGEALTKGDLVYVSGVSGDIPIVAKAKADDVSKMPVFGLAVTDANNNAGLQVATFGTLEGLDTSGVSEGQILYASTTAGAYTTTKPTGESSQIQNIGKVIRSHAAAGSIKVGGAGRSNDVPNLNNGKIFIGNASNQAVTSTLDTSIVVENTNLYFTNARVESYLDAGTSTPTFASAVINSSLTGSAILDDDTFGTASATTVATSESIKAYVDSQVGTVDTLSEILANGNTTGGNNIVFADNDKAIFGAGSDLQIYHDGSNSYIKENGTGALNIAGQGNINFTNSAGSETYAQFTADSSVKLYHDNSIKLTTSSSGIDVTGTVTSDGIELEENTSIYTQDATLSYYGSTNAVYLNGAGNNGWLRLNASGANNDSVAINLFGTNSGNAITFKTATSEAMRIDSSQNVMVGGTNSRPAEFTHPKGISFRGDIGQIQASTDANTALLLNRDTSDGTIVEFRKDGTTVGVIGSQNWGIGTSSPNTNLHIYDASGGATLKIESNTANAYDSSKIQLLGGNLSTSEILLGDASSATTGRIIYRHDGNSLAFDVNGSEAGRFDSSGNFGIGVTPAAKLDVLAGGDQRIIFGTLGTDPFINAVNAANSSYKMLQLNGSVMRLMTGGSERARIDSSGNFGLGTSSPQNNSGRTTLTISNSTNGGILEIFGASDTRQLLIYNTTGESRFETLSGGSEDLVFRPNGSEQMRITSTGLGIGTTSPVSKLSIENTGSSTVDAITLDWEHLSTTTNIEQRIQWRFGDDATADTFLNAGYIGSGKQGSWQSGAERDSYLSFGTTNDNTQTEKMRLDSLGNLLVGVTSTTLTGGSLTLPNSGIIAFHDAAGNARNALQFVSGQLKHGAAGAGLTSQTFHTSNVEAMRIDSSQRVGIGTTSPEANMHIQNGSAGTITTSNSQLLIENNTTSRLTLLTPNVSGATIEFGDSDDQDAGRINYDHSGDFMRFYTSGSERARILSDGKLLVGKTAASIATTGVELRPNGQLFATQSENYPLLLNRTTSDGAIIQLRKDNTTIGNIGSFSAAGNSYLTIGSGDTGLLVNSISDALQPWNISTNAGRDAAIDLGATSGRFKDLHLSGTAYVDTVGIGTTSPDAPLTVHSSSDPEIRLGYSSSQDHRIAWDSAKLFLDADPDNQNNNSILGFRVDGSEAGRFDASGNFYVGTTDSTLYSATSGGGIFAVPNGSTTIARQSNTSTQPIFILNETGVDGTLQEFRKDGSVVGSISTVAGYLGIADGDTGLLFREPYDDILPYSSTANSAIDDTIDLGDGSFRFQDIFATNGTIQTSDINEKQDIEDLSEAETRVAVSAKGLLKKYRWKSAVADKGDDARIHFGIMAQDLENAFANEGLDAGDYGMFISTTWTDEATGEEKTRLGVRYNELLAFIIAGI